MTFSEQSRSALASYRKSRPPEVRFWEKVDRRGGAESCWPWCGGRSPDGYGLTKFEPYGPTSVTHRVAYRLCKGTFAEKLRVLHSCDNPPCCNPAHLFLGTDKDNSDDKISKGRDRKSHGEEHAKAKLTAAQVLLIRSRDAAGDSRRGMAREFGLNRKSMWNICERKSWKHV